MLVLVACTADKERSSHDESTTSDPLVVKTESDSYSNEEMDNGDLMGSVHADTSMEMESITGKGNIIMMMYS